jgi:hypothetical protein
MLFFAVTYFPCDAVLLCYAIRLHRIGMVSQGFLEFIRSFPCFFSAYHLRLRLRSQMMSGTAIIL